MNGCLIYRGDALLRKLVFRQLTNFQVRVDDAILLVAYWPVPEYRLVKGIDLYAVTGIPPAPLGQCGYKVGRIGLSCTVGGEAATVGQSDGRTE
jgi:hypothetical protein